MSVRPPLYKNLFTLKLETDVPLKAQPVELDILNEIPPQVNEIPAHFIHEMKTIAYDVT